MNLTGADWIVRWLEHCGITCVAGVPGGAVLPLYDALAHSRSIRHILARHEQGAGFIAQGIARSTGKIGVCIASSGPGATNLVTALADAKLDSVPLVCITGQVPTALIGTDAFQEVATVQMTTPIAKGSFFVAEPKQLASTFAQAFELAQSGRPGPVVIDVPKDIQCARVRDWLPAFESGSPPAGDDRYDEVARLLHAAERPLLYVGGGVRKSRAQTHLRELSEQAQLPVVSTLMALGVMPDEHPMNLGMLGMHGARFTNAAIDECDLLLAIGARFDDRATGRVDRFAPHARIVHIDIDPREIGKIKQPLIGIADDAQNALRALLTRARPCNRSHWLARIERLRADLPLRRAAESGAARAHRFIRHIAALAGPDAFVTTDVGQHQMWVAQSYPFHRADRWLTSGGLGTMGFGVPAAIGAALAHPDATVLCFTGDGSLLMNIQELATLAELQANVKIILFDNAALGLVHQQQQLFYGGNLMATRYSRPSDFITLAHAFGIAASDVETSKWSTLLTQRGPALLRIPIDANAHVMPMVAPGAANVEALE
ncbi:MAG: biosynthetic-type acetolactate synthase large subunit [Steroidobacteraceae bacterium]